MCQMLLISGFLLVLLSISATSTAQEYQQTDPSLKVIKASDNHYYYVGTSSQMIWFQALLFCKAHNMELVSIETKEEQDFLWQAVRNLTANNITYWYWTSGIANPPPAGNFAWTGTGQPFHYSNWGLNEPNTADGLGCVSAELMRGTVSAVWRNSPCREGGLAFPLCEKLVIAAAKEKCCGSYVFNIGGN